MSFEEADQPVRFDERQSFTDTTDHLPGALRPASEQPGETAEHDEEDGADGGGGHDEDRAVGRRAPVVPDRHVEAMGDEDADKGEPEEDVQHDGRADALGSEGEPGIGARHPRLGEEPVAEGGGRRRAARGHMAEGERRQVDAEEPQPAGAAVGQDGVSQLGVGDEGGDLEEDSEDQVGGVDMGQAADLGPVGGGQGQGHVEDEEEGQDGAHAEADFAASERPPVPPAAPSRAWSSARHGRPC
jgi:hypothetical protein